MRVRITKAMYEEAMRVLQTPEEYPDHIVPERSCVCVMAAAMRAANPGHEWMAGPTEATIAGDLTYRWWGFSPEAQAMVKRFDSGDAWPEDQPDEVEFEAFSEEEGTYA